MPRPLALALVFILAACGAAPASSSPGDASSEYSPDVSPVVDAPGLDAAADVHQLAPDAPPADAPVDLAPVADASPESSTDAARDVAAEQVDAAPARLLTDPPAASCFAPCTTHQECFAACFVQGEPNVFCCYRGRCHLSPDACPTDPALTPAPSCSGMTCARAEDCVCPGMPGPWRCNAREGRAGVCGRAP